jgi:hypothetical protein
MLAVAVPSGSRRLAARVPPPRPWRPWPAAAGTRRRADEPKLVAATTVTAPPDVGIGCVGFVVDHSTGRGSLTLTVDSFVGEVTSCLGAVRGADPDAVEEDHGGGMVKKPLAEIGTGPNEVAGGRGATAP